MPRMVTVTLKRRRQKPADLVEDVTALDNSRGEWPFRSVRSLPLIEDSSSSARGCNFQDRRSLHD
jgi:hypothetical protein